jgi:hypothetical protein
MVRVYIPEISFVVLAMVDIEVWALITVMIITIMIVIITVGVVLFVLLVLPNRIARPRVRKRFSQIDRRRW